MFQKRVASNFTQSRRNERDVSDPSRSSAILGEERQGDWAWATRMAFTLLTGSTAGALIGLIFVVITLGMEHAKGDTVLTRLFVTPVLVYFASLLITSLP